MRVKLAVDISALDPDFKEHSTRGIGRYAGELKKFFDNQKNSKISYFDHNQLIKNSAIAKYLNYLPKGKVTAKQQILYPLRLRSLNCQTIHFLAQTDAPSWSPLPYIVSVMDVIPLVCKNLYKAANPNWKFHLARFFERQAIKNAKKIITISECSKKDIIKYYNVNPEDIFITPLGVNYQQVPEYDLTGLKEKYGIPLNKDFILYVGGIDQRKNLQGLLKSYKILFDIYQEKSEVDFPYLVLAGKISQDNEYPALKNLIQELDLADKIIETGFVSNEDLQKLYNACSAFCFLSLYEGFGLTPLEAMANGAVVLSSNTSAMPEVLGKAALFTNPKEYIESAKRLYELLHNQELRKELQNLGKKQVQKFTWKRTGEMTMEVYNQL